MLRIVIDPGVKKPAAYTAELPLLYKIDRKPSRTFGLVRLLFLLDLNQGPSD
ncbi:hypothetical protein PGTDC60_0007 [Porphyromonas gingivalis TDC60]|nr:hypothetical protein PGTDC60_0007 [Porphyromonas gingivalis TDC60]